MRKKRRIAAHTMKPALLGDCVQQRLSIRVGQNTKVAAPKYIALRILSGCVKRFIEKMNLTTPGRSHTSSYWIRHLGDSSCRMGWLGWTIILVEAEYWAVSVV